MGAISDSTRYYRTVIEIQLETKTYQTRLQDYIRERDNLIAMAEPHDVKGICYEQEKVQGSAKVIDEIWMLNRIGVLSHYINSTRKIIQDKKIVLQKLKETGARAAEKLNDIQKKIFIVGWVDNESTTISNKQILELLQKQGVYISLGTLTNKKSEINRIIGDIQISV